MDSSDYEFLNKLRLVLYLNRNIVSEWYLKLWNCYFVLSNSEQIEKFEKSLKKYYNLNLKLIHLLILTF